MALQDKTKNQKDFSYTNKFDVKRLGRSFKAAVSGVKGTYRKEQNIKIHTIVALLVVLFGFLLKISYAEWLACLLLIGFVLMAEFFNTAIEYVVDLASPDIHPLAKAAKDTASAGVLMMAILSAIVGLLIFVPKIIEVIGGLI